MSDGSPRFVRSRRVAAAVAAGALLLASPWWGRHVLAQLSFFRVRTVEIQGSRYIAPADLLGAMAVDTTRSVWLDLDPLEHRLARHPQVLGVEIDRRLPGTLVVHIEENLPVALVATEDGFEAVDALGMVLPIEPSRTVVDLPILAQRDTAVLRLLSEVRGLAPPLYDRVSAVRRVAGGELLVQLASVPVRAPGGLSAARLVEVLPVERDLARRRARVAELDLRFRDQVIARLQ